MSTVNSYQVTGTVLFETTMADAVARKGDKYTELQECSSVAKTVRLLTIGALRHPTQTRPERLWGSREGGHKGHFDTLSKSGAREIGRRLVLSGRMHVA